MLLADLCRMCENCRFYNGEGDVLTARCPEYAKNVNAIAAQGRPPAATAAAAAAGAKPPGYFDRIENLPRAWH